MNSKADSDKGHGGRSSKTKRFLDRLFKGKRSAAPAIDSPPSSSSEGAVEHSAAPTVTEGINRKEDSDEGRRVASTKRKRLWNRLFKGARSAAPTDEFPTKAKAAWRELPLAWIGYLRTEIDCKECVDCGKMCEPERCERKKLIDGARRHLRIAESACRGRSFMGMRSSGVLERIWANMRVADVNLLALSSDDELKARCAHVLSMVQRHISKASPQRIEVEKTIERIRGREGPISKEERNVLIGALGISYSSLDAKYRRVRVLGGVLWMATCFSLLGAGALAVWGAFDEQTLSLCFEQRSDAIGNREVEDKIVCPTGEHAVDDKKPFVDDYADRLDVLSVEIAGLVGAALTTVASLRGIHDDHSAPYQLSLAAATLKFPMGAISAFVGILFIRGAFLPGLSALDTSTQIIAWAVLFGAAQHLVTHLVDRRAEAALSGVGKPPGPPSSANVSGV
ncbi:hypothetical protein ABZX62_00920 [Streptomyces flavidovirens]|uniref:hypothetical protein n=1 Tax=Streptomyces flavidovirens TaxID=67298 RepID=UPI0033AB6B7A